MNTKHPLTIAIYRSVTGSFTTILEFIDANTWPETSEDYVRISEPIQVKFTEINEHILRKKRIDALLNHRESVIAQMHRQLDDIDDELQTLQALSAPKEEGEAA